MKKTILSIALLACAASFAGTLSTTEKNASTIKSSQSVTLKYSEEEGTYIGYLKSTLSRQRAYTVYTQGVTTNMELSVSVYPKEKDSEDAKEPQAEFEEVDVAGDDIYQVMYADSWYIDDEDAAESDPKSWVYYFEFTAETPATFTVNFSSSVVLPEGIADNPRLITPAAATNTVKSALQTGGEYFFRARLSEGVMYSFSTSGGSEEKDVAFSIDIAPEEDDSSIDDESGDGGDEEDDTPSYEAYDDPAFAEDPYNEGMFVVPDTTGYFIITISGEGISSNETENAQFAFSHKKYSSLTPAQHDVKAALLPGDEVECVAGRLCDISTGAYDAVVEESLYSFTAVKGGRYAAETSGAAASLLMRVYDAKGNVLVENETLDGVSDDVRCAFEASAAGTYYVGVCESLEDFLFDEPSYSACTLKFESIAAADGDPDEWDAADDAAAGATPLEVNVADSYGYVFSDGAASGVHRLSKTDWFDTFSIAARKDVVYALGFEFADPEEVSPLPLHVEVFTLSGTKETEVDEAEISPGYGGTVLEFTAAANAVYYVRVRVNEMAGLDYPGYVVKTMAQSSGGAELGVLRVNLLGAETAAFSIGSETVKYPSGSAVVLPGNTYTVKFSAVSGLKTPAQESVKVEAGAEETVLDVYYSDTSDPGDDTPKGAASWALKNVETSFMRTLWETDREDNFAITGADGYYYDFSIASGGADAVFSITNAERGVIVADRTSASLVNLPKSASKYYLAVRHADAENPAGGGYVVSGFFKNVGAIKFAKTAVSVRETASAAAVQVKRTAKEGRVRVRYRTSDGTAAAGDDYVEQSGILEWVDGDSKAKTISVKLIPELVAYYKGDRTFDVILEPLDESELEAGEYPASIAGGEVCTVTMTESSRPGATVESAYAAKAPKAATVKTATVPLETGTYYGVIEAEKGALTNGFPQLASVTFTASTANPAALSAKVALAGKTYSFSAKGWDEDGDEGEKTKTFALARKVNGVTYTNTLSVTVNSGSTAAEGDWTNGVGQVELVMNVPDANNKGVQRNVNYSGTVFRNNAKVQDYLAAVTNFTGYYTISLIPSPFIEADEGIPSGYGYITLAVDNKGTAKVAGMLADGTTKPSLSVAACRIEPDGFSANGYSMYVPVYFAKSPNLFGGTIRLYKSEADGPVVAAAPSTLTWNNDNPAVRYDCSEGFALELMPAGGWFDTLINLERYYLDSALRVSAGDVAEFPKELLPSGYDFTVGGAAQADGEAVSVAANAFSVQRRSLVKDGTSYDWTASVNPANVQVKLARATGLVSGSFSAWSENASGAAREVTGFKHNGVLILAHDPDLGLDESLATVGFAFKQIPLSGYVEAVKRNVSRKWTFSFPFCVAGPED